jgi:hypothetical protein
MTCDTYGTQLDDIAAVREAIESAVGIRFDRRENIAYGPYYCGRCGEEDWSLFRNFDEEFKRPLPGYPSQTKVLLQIDCTVQGPELERKLVGTCGLQLLRRGVLKRQK